MKTLRCGWKLGLAALTVVACAAEAVGAEPVYKAPPIVAGAVTGIVTDERGRPIEGVTVTICGVEKFHEGRWHRNRRPHCLIPRPSVSDKAGRFTFDLRLNEIRRLNFWFDKEGFAPTFLSAISIEPQDVKVIMKRGIQVSGTVKRLTEGQLEPVEGAAVYLQCSSGDLAHQKRVFDDPYFFLLNRKEAKEGCDLPYRQRVLTDLGTYTFRLTPPPQDKKWFLVCLNEGVILDVKEGQPTKGPDFEVVVQVHETGTRGVRPAVDGDGQ